LQGNIDAMSKAHLDAMIALLVIGGALISFAVTAWLAYYETGEGALAAVVGLATILLNHAAAIVRNRFPGPEIDVIPPERDSNGQKVINEQE
jgi:hypothetical protein